MWPVRGNSWASELQMWMSPWDPWFFDNVAGTYSRKPYHEHSEIQKKLPVLLRMSTAINQLYLLGISIRPSGWHAKDTDRIIEEEKSNKRVGILNVVACNVGSSWTYYLLGISFHNAFFNL